MAAPLGNSGPTPWLHMAATLLLTFYHTSAKRGAMLADVIDVAVDDHWKPYYTMPSVALVKESATPIICAS